MPAESDDNLHLEIGHVLFIDIVGYSRLLIEEQKERLNQLAAIVLATAPVREATDEQLVRLPTGDGMALVFHHSAEEPARCALEIAEALRKHPELPVRMGIHSGPVSEVKDVSGRNNIAGAGINMARRVMDCGDAGHILVSQHVADDLAQYRQWAPRLHDLGDCEVKHGVRLHLVNLYSEPLGNGALPQKFRQAAEKPVVEKPARRISFGWIAVLALAAILAAGAVYYFTSHRTATPSTAAPEAPKSAPIPEKSIAVLPMVNSTGDPANEYFSDGMSEEFISSLSRLPNLKVIGRTSSFQFKATKDDSKTIGEKLGVYYLLEGSVRKSADRVRIDVALVKASDGANVWSETYDRELKDIFAVQSEIASSVAAALKVTFLGGQRQARDNPPSGNVAAYKAYLQGKFQEARVTRESYGKAIEFYDRAIRLDPQYALAYARMSLTWTNYAAEMLGGAEAQEGYTKARAAADQALSLNPELALGHAALGWLLSYTTFDHTISLAEFHRALELDPNDSEMKNDLATELAVLGQLDEAVRLTQEALATDPLHSGWYGNLAAYLSALGRTEEAETAIQKAIAPEPDAAFYHRQLAIIQIQRGEKEAALRSANLEPDPFWRMNALALAYDANGDRAKSNAELKTLVEQHANESAVQIAQIYAARKEPEKMFEWLERGWNQHDPGITGLLCDPFMLPYRNDARFIALCRKAGLTAAN